MQIVVPAETWENERRVALIPDSVKKLVRAGLPVSVESGLGSQSGLRIVRAVPTKTSSKIASKRRLVRAR